jgi:hypothetical protein
MNPKIQQINELAITLSQIGIAHVFVSYAGHVDALYVYAHPTDHPYSDEAKGNYLLNLGPIYLGWDDADERLDDAIAQLTALHDQAVAA